MDDLLVVQKFLPAGSKGHILLTTRSQSTGNIAQPLPLEKMTPDEGALYLLHRARFLDPDASLEQAVPTDIKQAREIVQEIDGLPLALDQAAAYIEETRCSLSDYLQLYRTSQAELLKRRGRYTTDHPESVATTWLLAFEKLQQTKPAAVALLRLCAYLDPDVIPEEILTQGRTVLGAELQSVVKNRHTLNETISELLNYSLIRRNPDHTLTIHRLVQAVIQQSMNKALQRRWAERAVKAISLAFPEVTHTNWLQCQQYMPQILTCTALIDTWKMTFSEATNLLMEAASYLHDHADYTQAQPLSQRALDIRERMLGPDHPSTAATLNNLALLYQAMGQHKQAEPLFQRALDIYERMLGPDHPSTAATLDNLAGLYQDMGQHKQAEPLFQRALDISERMLGPDHPDTATTLNNLALLYQDMGQHEQAQPLFQRALNISENERK